MFSDGITMERYGLFSEGGGGAGADIDLTPANTETSGQQSGGNFWQDVMGKVLDTGLDIYKMKKTSEYQPYQKSEVLGGGVYPAGAVTTTENKTPYSLPQGINPVGLLLAGAVLLVGGILVYKLIKRR